MEHYTANPATLEAARERPNSLLPTEYHGAVAQEACNVLRAAFRARAEGRAHVLFHYSGHVQGVEVSAYSWDTDFSDKAQIRSQETLRVRLYVRGDLAHAPITELRDLRDRIDALGRDEEGA